MRTALKLQDVPQLKMRVGDCLVEEERTSVGLLGELK
jgi:hypothetical protein